MSNTHIGAHPIIPRMIRLFSVPILLFWLALTVVVNVVVPQLEVVGQSHAVSLAPNDAPSMQATKRAGQDFQEFDSNSSAMIVLESDQPLGADAHHYYDGLIQKLEADKKHVEHIQDFWGIRSRRRDRRAPTTRPPTCSCTWRATRGRAWRTSPSKLSGTSSRVLRRYRGSRPMSPVPRR